MSTTSSRQKVGLVIAGLISAGNLPNAFTPQPSGEGPPTIILVLDSILGLIGLVAVVIAWRSGKQAAFRIAAGALVLSMLTGLPAFFVDVPAWVKLLVAVSVVVTVAAVVLMFSGVRRVVGVRS